MHRLDYEQFSRRAEGAPTGDSGEAEGYLGKQDLEVIQCDLRHGEMFFRFGSGLPKVLGDEVDSFWEFDAHLFGGISY